MLRRPDDPSDLIGYDPGESCDARAVQVQWVSEELGALEFIEPVFVQDNNVRLGSKAPDFRGMTLRGVLEESAARGLSVEVAGSGLVRTQDPAPGTPLSPRAHIQVQLGR